jgi:hypothetical protein
VDRLRQKALHQGRRRLWLISAANPPDCSAIDNDRITFTYKDRNDNNRTKSMVLPVMEFIRRFLLHVLPKRFMKIRYYGFLANVGKKKAVLLIRR